MYRRYNNGPKTQPCGTPDTTLTSLLNTKLAKVAEWFDSNKLTLNVNKTQMLMMSRKKNVNPKGDVILSNEAIEMVPNSKFLGVIVEQRLKLERPHINGITQNI